MRLANFSCPATRGVWINQLYSVPTADGSLTDQSGLTPVPLDARPFRIIIQTVHITATLGGFLDLMALRQEVTNLVEVAFLMLRVGQPPNLNIWAEAACGTDATAQRIQPDTLLIDVARMLVPAIRFKFLIQDPPTAVNRNPTRELLAPEIVLL